MSCTSLNEIESALKALEKTPVDEVNGDDLDSVPTIASVAFILSCSGFPEVAGLAATSKEIRGCMNLEEIENLKRKYHRRMYRIFPASKKSLLVEELYTKRLSNGKVVKFELAQFWRGGTFIVTLTNDEKDAMLEEEDVDLGHYDTSCEEMWDVWDRFDEIKNSDQYTTEEMQEITRLLYCGHGDIYDSNEDYGDSFVDYDVLDYNNWTLDETNYKIFGGIDPNMELISD
jgi:hypothetical protein